MHPIALVNMALMIFDAVYETENLPINPSGAEYIIYNTARLPIPIVDLFRSVL